MFKIEKNIPIPKQSGGVKHGTPKIKAKGQPPKYPLKTMEIGDTFFTENVDVSNMRSATYACTVRHGKKFSVFKHGNGSRVTRVK